MLDIITQHPEDFALIGTSLIAIASALANIIPKDTFFGKLVHFVAINFKVK